MRAELLGALLLAAAFQAPATELGTLLTTPQERERLERLRRGEPESPVASSGAGGGQVTGFVKRSDGHGTLFVDGMPVDVSVARAGKLLDPAAVGGRGARNDDRLTIERRPRR